MESITSLHMLRDVGTTGKELRGDREIVMRAVSSDGLALQHATMDLRGDREVVMKALSSDGFALQYVAKELRDDSQLMDLAMASTSCPELSMRAARLQNVLSRGPFVKNSIS